MAGSEPRPAGVVRHRWLVVLAWSLASAILGPSGARLERRLDVAVRVEGSESEAVERVLADRFGSPFARYAVLVIAGVPAPSTPAGRQLLRTIADAVSATPGVLRTFSYLDAPDTLFAGAGGGTFLVAGLAGDAGAPADAHVAVLRRSTASLAPLLRARYPALTLRWTGELALNHDLRTASAGDVSRAERRALPLTAVLLGLAFGAVTAALLPAAAGLLAIATALGIAALLARWLPLAIVLQNVVSMLGLGLGIDYALLMVSRFREGMSADGSALGAATLAAREAGRTIATSGAVVAIGFAALLVVPLSELRSVAIGGLLIVATSVLAATTLLPAVLGILGAHVDRGRWGRVRRGPAGVDRWRRWAQRVARHPWRTLSVAGLPMLLLALQTRRLDTRLPRGDWLPPGMESAQAAHELQAMRRSGIVQAIRIVLELPQGVDAREDPGWTAAARAAAALARDPRVARVRALATLVPVPRPSPTLLSLIPPDVMRTFVSRDGRSMLLEVMPRDGVDPRELAALVRSLRAADPATLTGLAGTTLRVGGLPALNVDYEDAIAASTPMVIALVVGGTLLALLIAFRSVLLSLKAIALNLLSVGAAFGAVVLVFQDGHGVGLAGLDAAVDGVFPSVPLLVFCIVFGLSMDYEVFLIGRIAEARRAGLDDPGALVEGVARSGGVITSAAAIMVAVFAAFTLGEFLLVKLLGFALATAVLLDATVVRLAVGPALLRLAGRWNWWPGDGRGAARRQPGSSVWRAKSASSPREPTPSFPKMLDR